VENGPAVSGLIRRLWVSEAKENQNSTSINTEYGYFVVVTSLLNCNAWPLLL
jgi:hypothetical protein